MLIRERCYIPKIKALKKATKYIGLLVYSLWSTSPRILVTQSGRRCVRGVQTDSI